METVATLAVGLVIDMGSAFKQVETGMGKLANVAATAGKAVAVGIGVGTAAIVAFAKKSVDMATTFESQMAIMSTAVEPMGPSMEELHQAMLKVGADNELIGITAAEAAEATTNFYKAGLATNDIFGDYNAYMEEGASLTGALRASIDLAAASDLELAAASELVAVSMAQYGLEAEDATGITDIFVKAADASQAEVSDLAVAMSYVGPTANAMNISIEDTATALAMLSEGGIKGSSAGTTLNRVLSDLNKTSPKAQEAMAALGIEMYDAEGKMKPLPELLAHLNEKLGEGGTITEVVGGVTEKLAKTYEKANAKIPALTTKISEQEQALAIMNRELVKTVEKYGDSSTQADKKRLAITKLTNDIAENKATLSGHLGVVDKYHVALDGATTSTRQLTDQERAEYTQAIFAARARRGLNVLLSEGAEGWETMAAKVESASTAEEVAAVRADTYAGSLEKLQGTMETLMISAGTPLKDEILRPLIDLFNKLITNSMPRIISAFEWFGDIVGKVVDIVDFLIDELGTGELDIMAFAEALTLLFPEDVANKIASFVDEILTAFEGGWPGIRDLLFTWAGRFWDWITAPGGAAELAGGKLQEILDVVTGWLAENWSAIAEKLAEWGYKFWDWVINVAVPQAVERLGELAEAFKKWSESSDAETAMHSVGKTIAGLMIDGIRTVLGMLTAWLPLGDTIAESLANITLSLGTLVENFVQGFIDGIAEKLGIELPPKFSEIVSEIIRKIVFPITIPLEMWESGELDPIFDQLETLGTLIKTIVGPAFEELKIAWAEVRTAFGEAWTELKPIFDEIIAVFADPDAEKGAISLRDILKIVVGGFFKLAAVLAVLGLKKVAKNIKNFAAFIKALAKVVKKVVTFISKLWKKHGDKILKLLKIVSKFLRGDASKAWKDIWKIIKEVLDDIWKKVKDIWDKAWKWIRDRLDDIWKEVKDIWGKVWDWIQDRLDDIWDYVKGTWTKIWNWIRDRLDDIWDHVKDIWNKVWNWIQDRLDDIWNYVKDTWTKVWNWIRDRLDDIWDKVKEIWDKVWAKIRDALDDIWSKVQDIWDKVLAKIRDVLGDIWDVVQDTWNRILAKIREVLDNIIAKVREWATQLYNAFRDALFSLLDAIDEVADDLIALGKQIIQYIIDGIRSFTTFASDLAGQLAGWIYQVATNAAGVASLLIAWAKAVGIEVINWVLEGIRSVTTFISGVVDKVSAWLKEIAESGGDIITQAKRIGRLIVDWFVDGIKGVGDFAKRVKDWIIQMLKDIIGVHSITLEEASMRLGASMADALLAGFLDQRAGFIRGLKDELNEWVDTAGAAVSPLTMMMGGGGALGTAGGGDYSATFNTSVYNEMDLRRLEFMVQEILRDMSKRGY